MIRVSVIIPTFRRPASFMRAAGSVLAQTMVDGVELIAVDNSIEGSAIDAFKLIEQRSHIPFRWMHEPNPGVANARNAALKLARGELIAWLDDDEEASPGWLEALIAQREQTGAQAVFGPVRAKALTAKRDRGYYEALYSRTGPDANGVIARAYGIGNSLMPCMMFEGEMAPFAANNNETGGEDDVLFSSWAEAGATFAWATNAVVTEHVAEDRTRLSHGLKRAFAYGQGPCETAWAQRNHAALARHMAIGAAQALLYGASALVAYPASRASAITLLDRAARGAGKVLWFWEQRFYGEAA